MISVSSTLRQLHCNLRKCRNERTLSGGKSTPGPWCSTFTCQRLVHFGHVSDKMLLMSPLRSHHMMSHCISLHPFLSAYLVLPTFSGTNFDCAKPRHLRHWKIFVSISACDPICTSIKTKMSSGKVPTRGVKISSIGLKTRSTRAPLCITEVAMRSRSYLHRWARACGGRSSSSSNRRMSVL